VSEIRENGFFVFVPRFGIKGPVYLKNKEEEITMPLSAVTGNINDVKTMVNGCDIQIISSTKLRVSLPNNLPQKKSFIDFNLFDKVKVSLKLKKSHAHRHTIYMVLISLEEDH